MANDLERQSDREGTRIDDRRVGYRSGLVRGTARLVRGAFPLRYD
jgi:hypothetical protein